MTFPGKLALALALMMGPVAASACFPTPDSRPLLGCMPYNFSAPMDWASAQGGNDDATRPELVCYRHSARLHVDLIERLHGQMQSGQPADAFSPLANAPDLNSGSPYDFGATQYIKTFTPDFVRAYYPPLYAIVREFESCLREVANKGCGDVAGCRLNGAVFMGHLPDGSQYPVVGLPDFDDAACSADMRAFLGEGLCDTLKADDIEGVLALRGSAPRPVLTERRLRMPDAPIHLIQPGFWGRVWVRIGELVAENSDRFDVRTDAIAFTAQAWAEVATRRFPTVAPSVYRVPAALVGASLDIGAGQVDPSSATDVANTALKLVYTEFLAHVIARQAIQTGVAQAGLRLAVTSQGVAVIGTAATATAGISLGIVIAAIEDVIEDGPPPAIVPETLIAHELGLMGQFCAEGRARPSPDMIVAIPDGRLVSHVSRATCETRVSHRITLGA